MNTEPVSKCPCDVCGKTVHFGPHYYGGRRNSTYKIIVCDSCRVGNHDGWAPYLEERVTKVLREKGLPLPHRNAKGLLPIMSSC